MATPHQLIFSPLRIGHVELRNRIVVPPMVQLRPITSDAGIAWYRRLAAGGPGLVIVEATGIPGFGAELTAETLRPLVEAIHAGGAAAAIQLFPIAFGQKADPNSLSVEQIDGIVGQYGRAATICLEAGFDGVEPHGAHGYLLNQFFMPDKNRRADDYGGSRANRGRLAVRIVEQISAVAGAPLLILYRHTPTGQAYTLDDSLALAGRLIDAGVDVLDISPARQTRVAELAAPFKERFPNAPVIAVGGMDDPDAAVTALVDGHCDLVAVGRQLIADAHWPRKVREGRLNDIRNCEKCDVGCFGNLREQKPVKCALWDDDEVAAYAR